MAKLSEIAAWVGAPAPLAADNELLRVSNIEAAAPDSIVFATDPKTLSRALASSAGLILAKTIETTPDARVLGVADPRYAFAQIAARLRPPTAATEIHPTAIIDPSAQVGEGSKIGPGCTIAENVVIGSDCKVGPRVTIYPNTVVGDRVHIQAGAVLGSQGFGYVRHAGTGEYILFPQQGTLVIEDDVDVGANTTIDRGALGETRIGAGSKIDNLVHIGHNCVVGRNVIIAAQTGISGSSVIEDSAILGGQVGIGEHALVGTGVILGGGAGVLSGKKMHGPGEVFWGRPARPLKEYLKDLARLKRR
jgi:UDP-3-O-[3-hydroxymyristoyl] glucosamine N-acyltransferase